MELIKGFEPVFDEESQVLILGSFPSVKSRKVDFYYGNKQNRFWKTVSSFFGDEVPEDTAGKIDFLKNRKIALWDIVTECEIVGSKDSTIKNFRVADLKNLLQNSKISFIIVNGNTAFKIFCANYADIGVPFERLPSTSPANTRFSKEEWHDALSRAFGKTQ